jgi:hypothetical protein
MKMTGNAHHDANCIQIFGKGMKMTNEICEKHKVVGCQDCKNLAPTAQQPKPPVTGSSPTAPTDTLKF